MRRWISRAHGASRAPALAAALGFFSGAPGCSRSPSGGSPPEDPSEGHSARLLADASAFDLAPAADGALLVWAPKDEGQLRWRRFDARGQGAESEGASLPVGSGLRDLSLVVTPAGAALAWREAEKASSSSRVAWVEPDGSARRFELGPGGGGPAGSRGSLALVAQGDGALLFARGAATPCEGGAPEPCAAFQFFRLSASGARATGVPLVVPSPCDEQAAQLVLVPGRTPNDTDALGRFDYAVCSRGAGAGLTVFSIQPNPAYAMAQDVFAGCTPLGAGRFAGEGGFVAACGPSRRLATAPGGGESLVVRDLDRRGLVCRNGAAQLAFGSGWLGLNEPMGKLELLLDDALAPRGARAVWAGAALLVARVDDAAQLLVSSYACRDDVLVEESEVLDMGATKGAP
jgi:hypothetical protein